MTQENKLPPVTEEDMPAVKKMIERLVRMRKREVAHDHTVKADQLSEAISELIEYGYWHDWWKKQKTGNFWDDL